MYTGTLIQDLMATVERAQLRADQRRFTYEQELHDIFAMPIPITDEERTLLGAA